VDIFSKLLVFISLIASTVTSSLGFNHQSSIKHEETTKIIVASPSAQISVASPSAVVTPLPSKLPDSKHTVQNTPQPSVKHDGSRTGQVVDYLELCTGKTIKIFENELIAKVAADGKTYARTKGDWDCLDRNTTTQQKSGSSNSPNSPSNGANSTGNNYVYNQPYTYNYPTPSPSSVNIRNTQQQTPVNIPQPVDHSQDLQLCLDIAQNNYQHQYNALIADLNRRGAAVYQNNPDGTPNIANQGAGGQEVDSLNRSYALQQQSCHLRWGN